MRHDDGFRRPHHSRKSRNGFQNADSPQSPADRNSFSVRADRCLRQLPAEEWIADPTQEFLVWELEVSGDGKSYTHRGDRFLTEYKHCELPKAKITHRLSRTEDGKFLLELETDKPVFYLFAEFRKIRATFSDNSFALLPGKTCRLTFRTGAEVSLEELEQALVIRDLRSSYDC